MSRGKRAVVGLAISLLVVIVLFVALESRNQSVTFGLADGTVLSVAAPQSGKVFHFFEGNILQKTIFGICRTNLPVWLRGYEIILPASTTNGGLGIEIRHLGRNNNPATVNSSERLLEMDQSGREIEGQTMMVNFKVGDLFRRDRVTEEIFWEFPLSAEKEIHFHLYLTNRTTQMVSTNEFTMPNPAFRVRKN